MHNFSSGKNQQGNSELETFPRQCGREYWTQEGRPLQAVVGQSPLVDESAQQRSRTESEWN